MDDETEICLRCFEEPALGESQFCESCDWVMQHLNTDPTDDDLKYALDQRAQRIEEVRCYGYNEAESVTALRDAEDDAEMHTQCWLRVHGCTKTPKP